MYDRPNTQYTTDLIPGTQYTIHNTGHTWCQRLIAQQSQYLACNAASTQSQYSVRITGGLVPNTHRVRDLIPTVEPPNKGHFGSGAFVLFSGGCPSVGGSSQYAIYSPHKT